MRTNLWERVYTLGTLNHRPGNIEGMTSKGMVAITSAILNQKTYLIWVRERALMANLASSLLDITTNPLLLEALSKVARITQ